MGPADQSPRLYNCQRCGLQVHICRQCDRGNVYCTTGCAPIRRQESLQRAGAHYQRTHRGACRHAARQSQWRARQRKEVTHQGSLAPEGAVTVNAPAVDVTSEPIREPSEPVQALSSPVVAWDPSERPRCSVCRRVLSVFTRLEFLRHWR